jgi:uncharacterized protein (UPF0332 family)
VAPSAEVQIHLKLAQEFLDVAKWSFDAGFYNASQTNAVTSAIRAKDAVAHHFNQRSNKAVDHGRAVSELKGIGEQGGNLAAKLAMILKEKNKFAYQDAFSDRDEALVTLKRATSFLEQVRGLVVYEKS